MPSRSLSAIVQHIRSAGRDGSARTDGELLTRFLSERDEDALAALVERHARMVWGVCRRVLRHPHDTEDAFQATFLVLVQKAATVVPRDMVANWLYGAAQQTAVRLRATVAKRGWREVPMDVMPEPAVAEACDEELLARLDEELKRLPERCRALIVLCDLEGRTRKEVARQLGCPEGTVASGLVRARELLAKRLTRRGLAVSGGSLAATLSHSVASADVPALVVTSVINVATLVAAGKAAGVISGPVATLTQGVLKTMFLKKILTTTVAVLALGVAVITGGSLAVGQTEGTGKPSDKPPAAAEKPIEKPPAAAEKPLVAKAAARDVVVNTPTILGKLQGEWELQPKVENEYKQRISFTTGNSGSWQRSEGTLPVTITYYVEGQELLIQHNYEPNGAFNYRLKQLRFEYAISNDKSILTLTAGDKTQTWKRSPKANPKEGERVAPQKEPFTAWGKEVGGLQAGLGFKAGEKRVYTHGEKVTLVVRLRNVGTEPVTFGEGAVVWQLTNPISVTDSDGKAVYVQCLRPFGSFGQLGHQKTQLPPGKEVEYDQVTLQLKPAVAQEKQVPDNILLGSGKFRVEYRTDGFGSNNPTTGKLELEVKEAPAETPKVLTPEQAVKIAGDSKLAREFNENKSAVSSKSNS
jgi:RNA polymerase sigma factor (sigma-70 family)